MQPDSQIMQQHLLHLFGNEMCGVVELAWRDPINGKITHARNYHLDDLDKIADEAAAINRIEGQNAYIGAAIRKQDVPPFGRNGDADFLCAPAYWADLDDGEAVRTARQKCAEAPPNLAVITGRHPHARAQLWWRCEESVTDADLVRRQNAAIAAALDGDPSVSNPGRIMRLAGSVAWPTKPGRIAELTELVTWPDRPTAYVDGEVAKAFPTNGAKSLKVSAIFGVTTSAPDRWVEALREGAAQGERNTTAAALCGYLFRRDIRPDEAWEMMRAVNQARFVPPLDETELRGVFESIAAKELQRRIAS